MSVSLRLNEKYHGIELIFSDDSRPDKEVRDRLKDNGFRWHTRNKYWFANYSEERLSLAKALAGQKSSEKVSPVDKSEGVSEALDKLSEPKNNSFAESYEAIGSASILASADVDIFDANDAYFKDANVHFGRTYSGDVISVTDLTNAGRNGKTCTVWRLSPLEWGGNAGICLANNESIHTCEELINALRSDRSLSSVNISSREEKGVEVFSPFTETRPLSKLPERWNKRNFINAMLSGQIYKGTLNQRLTDDYAYDAAYNFGEGKRLNIPASARSAVEDWSSLASIRTGRQISESVHEIDYYDGYSSSKTYLFDLNCDIREGKRRDEEYMAGLAQYNKMMESACIEVPYESIDPEKIYTITVLDKYTNDEIYSTKEDCFQGYLLREKLEEDGEYMDILSVEEMSIEPAALYQVSSFFSRREGEPDERIAECGNYSQYVTGKALLELTSEEVYFPVIKKGLGEFADIDAARNTLKGFINGLHHYGFTGLSKEGYEKALDTLESEFARAVSPGGLQKGNLDDMIIDAKIRSANTQEKSQQGRNNLLR